MKKSNRSWAWLVVFAACLINLIMAGLGRMGGILYVAFIDTFHVDRKTASAPFSIRAGTRYLLGPVVGILGQKYGVRAVTLFGGIIGTISAAGCFFVQDIVWVTVLWGGINGLATALSVTLLQVVIAQYFEKDTATAAGIVFSGTCVGSFLFPVFIDLLLLYYGLDGTFLIIAAIAMHVIPAAMFLSEPSWLNDRNKQMKRLSDEEEIVAYEYNLNKRECPLHVKDVKDKASGNTICMPGKQFNDSIGRESEYLENYIDFLYLRKNKELVLQLFTMNNLSENMLHNASEKEKQITLTQDENSLLKGSEFLEFNDEVMQNKHGIFLDLMNFLNEDLINHFNTVSKDEKSYDKDQLLKTPSEVNNTKQFIKCKPQLDSKITYVYEELPYSKFFFNLEQLQGYGDSQIISFFPQHSPFQVLKIITEIRKIHALCNKLRCFEPDEETISQEKSTKLENSGINIQNQHIIKPVNSFRVHIKAAFQLHLNPLFLLICVCRIVYFITITCAVTVTVDFVIDQGLLEDDGKYVIAAFSAGDFIGRLCLGWITDRNYMSLDKYMLVIMILQGVCTISLPIMHTRYSLFPTIVIFGIFMGSEFVQNPVLVNKYIDSSKQSIAMGCNNFFPGFLGFVLPSYIGYFRDTVGAYNGIFYINGVLSIAAGLLWILKPKFDQCLSSGSAKENAASEIM
ncbi:uncharacterized protein LOC118205361 [Stegodyphus dumicola]|uniref:uncharacterized protein LOC118205361 n=1 Tax=Stegodyphus dumicola TaxID=202533 RepID=UPI0015AAC4EA|nr:uncharacterized protein LOC118205361 [Stegodyphus dumicola]